MQRVISRTVNEANAVRPADLASTVPTHRQAVVSPPIKVHAAEHQADIVEVPKLSAAEFRSAAVREAIRNELQEGFIVRPTGGAEGAIATRFAIGSMSAGGDLQTLAHVETHGHDWVFTPTGDGDQKTAQLELGGVRDAVARALKAFHHVQVDSLADAKPVLIAQPYRKPKRSEVELETEFGTELFSTAQSAIAAALAVNGFDLMDRKNPKQPNRFERKRADYWDADRAASISVGNKPRSIRLAGFHLWTERPKSIADLFIIRTAEGEGRTPIVTVKVLYSDPIGFEPIKKALTAISQKYGFKLVHELW